MTTYMFPGQGSQIKGMGSNLFNQFPKEINQANTILNYSIEELCVEDPRTELGKTEYTQPALFVVEALTFLEKSATNGTKPNYCIGHSLGEYSALFAAGAFDFSTGLQLVKKRGELMAKATGGGMLAVINLSIERIMVLLKQNGLDSVECANLNSPNQTVLSGTSADITRANEVLSGEAMMCIPLRVSGAFHSHYMNEAAQEFAQFIDKFQFNTLTTQVIANVSALPYEVNNIKENLVKQMTSPVKWYESINYIRQRGEMEFLELGPGTVLTKLLSQI